MALSSDTNSSSWPLNSLLLLALGLPHFLFMGIYVLLGGKEHAFQLMMVGLAATGGFVGFIQSLSVGPRALLITPVSFFLGYLPSAYFILGKSPRSEDLDSTAMLVMLLSSTLCILAGQLMLSRRDPNA